MIRQYGFKNKLISNQLTIVTFENRTDTEEYEATTISEIRVETIGGVYMLLQLKRRMVLI